MNFTDLLIMVVIMVVIVAAGFKLNDMETRIAALENSPPALYLLEKNGKPQILKEIKGGCLEKSRMPAMP